jgi:NADH-quinone oxidoreductase subunit E
MNEILKFSEQALALAQKIMKRYPEGKHKSAILPILHLAQAEFGGWLSVPAMNHVASVLKIQPIEVYEVVSFYSMFNLKPVGKCVIEVCRTGPCWLMGAEDILRYLEEKLDIPAGATTKDKMFTIKTVECLAACGTAPIVQIGEVYHENVTCEKIDQILSECRKTVTEPLSHWAREKIKAHE